MTNRQTKTAAILAFTITCGLALSTSIALTTLFSGFTIFGLAVLSYRLYTVAKGAQQKLTAAQADNQRFTTENANLKQQLTIANQNLKQSKAQQATLTNTIESLQTQLQNVTQQLEKAKTYINANIDVSAHTNYLTTQVSHLKNERNAAQEHIKQLQKALQNCEENLATVEQKRQRLVKDHQRISVLLQAQTSPKLFSTISTQTNAPYPEHVDQNALSTTKRSGTPDFV